MDKEFLELQSTIDSFYGKFYALNDKLLQRSEQELNDNENYNCIDIFDFYISSHAMAHLKCLYMQDYYNSSIYLSARCILEGLALKKLCKQSVVGTVKEKLLQKQVFLIEYQYYKEFGDIADKILLPEKLKNDWQSACEFYREELKTSEYKNQIEQIIKSKIPFICQPYTNYRKIIGEMLGEEMASLYGICSSLIHPSTNDSYKEDSFKMVLPIIGLLELEYGYLSQSATTLSSDLRATESPIANRFYQILIEEAEILFSVADVFEQKFKNNYVSNTFRTIGYILPDLAIDKQLGLTEQTKCKWKMIFELCATFSHLYVKCFGEEQRFRLLDIHKQVQIQRNINTTENLDECMSEAYQVYSTIYSNPCERNVFDTHFKKELGYLIDEAGAVPSLTKIVVEFTKPYESDINNGVSIGRAMYLDYMESQMLSHSNGYMWFANSGAFSDTNNIFIGIDACIKRLMQEVYNIFDVHRKTERNNDYKSIINVLRNSVKKIEALNSEKIEILHLPMAKKWHVG